MQLDTDLVHSLHECGFEIAIETNGTLELPDTIDWVCVSPKAKTTVIVRSGDELKLVVPQSGISPEEMIDWDFDHFYLQPMDSDDLEKNTAAALKYCLENPGGS